MKRRSQAAALPLDFDYHALLKRADAPPDNPPADEPPAAEPMVDPQALVRELGKRLTVGKAAPPRAPAPSSTRPAPIAARPKRYEHLSTPIETLERMAAANDRAAQIELARIREATAKAEAPNPGGPAS
jgi:hypothetical protein